MAKKIFGGKKKAKAAEAAGPIVKELTGAEKLQRVRKRAAKYRPEFASILEERLGN